MSSFKISKRKPKKCVKPKKKVHDPKVLEGMETASKRNKTRKFYRIAQGIETGFQLQMSVCKDRGNN